jgi:hypothetical protein
MRTSTKQRIINGDPKFEASQRINVSYSRFAELIGLRRPGLLGWPGGRDQGAAWQVFEFILPTGSRKVEGDLTSSQRPASRPLEQTPSATVW